MSVLARGGLHVTQTAAGVITRVRRVLRVRCQYCGHFREPADIRMLGDLMPMCRYCEVERHQPAVNAIRPAIECALCHTTYATLEARARATASKLSMFWHWIDGSYQALCKACSDAHVPKRQDLYKGTPFGRERGM
jgi:hypothetical protein